MSCHIHDGRLVNSTYSKIFSQQRLALCCGDWLLVRDLRATSFRAEMTISNCPVASGIKICSCLAVVLCYQLFKLTCRCPVSFKALGQGESGLVHIWTGTTLLQLNLNWLCLWGRQGVSGGSQNGNDRSEMDHFEEYYS